MRRSANTMVSSTSSASTSAASSTAIAIATRRCGQIAIARPAVSVRPIASSRAKLPIIAAGA